MAISRHDLICEDTGEVNLVALHALARQECVKTWGCVSPKGLREALREVEGLIPELQCAWRERHGLPVETVNIRPFGDPPDRVRRSAF